MFFAAQQLYQTGKKMRGKTAVVLHGSKDSTEIDEEDDLGGFGPEEDSPHRPRKTGLSMTEPGRSSAKRTGDRDDRGSRSPTPHFPKQSHHKLFNAYLTPIQMIHLT